MGFIADGSPNEKRLLLLRRPENCDEAVTDDEMIGGVHVAVETEGFAKGKFARDL